MDTTPTRSAAAGLAALGAAAAVPVPLAQLDFAGALDVFGIHAGDAPRGLLVLAAVGGVLTCMVVLAAFAGVALLLLGSPLGRPVLTGVAVAGLATAFPFWFPSAVLIGAAVLLCGVSRPEPGHDPAPRAGQAG